MHNIIHRVIINYNVQDYETTHRNKINRLIHCAVSFFRICYRQWLLLDELNKYECVDYEDFRTHYCLHCVTLYNLFVTKFKHQMLYNDHTSVTQCQNCPITSKIKHTCRLQTEVSITSIIQQAYGEEKSLQNIINIQCVPIKITKIFLNFPLIIMSEICCW